MQGSMATSNLAAVPSGELFYRAGCAEKSLAEGTSEEFREFLASDSNGEVQAERFAYQLGSLKKIKGLATANFEHAASLEKELCTKGLESIINSHISVMKCKHARITAALDRLQTSHDASMMTLTLQYFDILKKELEEMKAKLEDVGWPTEVIVHEPDKADVMEMAGFSKKAAEKAHAAAAEAEEWAAEDAANAPPAAKGAPRARAER